MKREPSGFKCHKNAAPISEMPSFLFHEEVSFFNKHANCHPPLPEECLNHPQQFRLVGKLRIVERAIKIGWVNPVAWEEDINSTNVHQWIEQCQELQQKFDHYKAQKMVNCFGVNAKYNLKSTEGLRDIDIEEFLLAFWKERNENNLPCSIWNLVRKWGQMQPKMVNVLSNNACHMRIYRFMQRNNLSPQKVTHQARPNNFIQENIDDFVQYVQMRMKMLGVAACNISNVDKTNIFFAPDTKWTIGERGVGQSLDGSLNHQPVLLLY